MLLFVNKILDIRIQLVTWNKVSKQIEYQSYQSQICDCCAMPYRIRSCLTYSFILLTSPRASILQVLLLFLSLTRYYTSLPKMLNLWMSKWLDSKFILLLLLILWVLFSFTKNQYLCLVYQDIVKFVGMLCSQVVLQIHLFDKSDVLLFLFWGVFINISDPLVIIISVVIILFS